MTRRSLLALLACLIFVPGWPGRIRSAPGQDKARPKPRTDRHGDSLPPGAVARLGTVRLQHGEETWGLAFAPDGKTLASGSDDGSVRLWDMATGREVRRFTGHNGLIRWVAFAPDGKALAATDDSRVRVWDLGTGKRAFDRPVSGRSPAGVAFSPDGKLLAAGSMGGPVTLFDRKTGKRLRHLGGGEHGSYLLAFSPDGRLLAASAFDRTVDLLDVRTGERLHTYPQAAEEVSALAFAPDGKRLAEAADDTVRLWAVEGSKEVRRFTFTHARVSWLRFSPDGKTLTAVSTDGKVAGWETATGKVVRRVGQAQGDFILTAVAQDGKTAAGAGDFGDIQLVDLVTGKEQRVAGACPSPILAVEFAEQGRAAVSTCFDATTLVWEPTTGRELRRFGPRNASTDTVTLSPQGKTLAFGDEKGTIHLWDVAGGRELRTWKGEAGETSYFMFSPDGRKLLTKGLEGPARVWAVDSGKECCRLGPDAGGFGLVAFAPDGRTFAIAEGREGRVQIWEVATGKRRLVFPLVKSPACVAFSPDRTLLGVGEEDGSIALYRAATGKLVRRLVRPGKTRAVRSRPAPGGPSENQPPPGTKDEREVFDLSFSPDGKYVASGREDRVVYLHDTATGQLLARLRGHQGTITALAFSPEGKLLVSGSLDRTALVWDVEAVVRPAAGGKSAPEGTEGRAGTKRSSAVRTLAPARLEALWAALGGADAERAGAALNEVVAHPRQAVPFLAGRLRPAPPADAQRLARLVTDLDSDQFPVRQKAARELEAAAERAEPLLRKVLEGKPPLETRRRMERLLEKLDMPITSPEVLRSLRAVEALERIGTPEAEELLRKLARGTPEARLTREAKAALTRPPLGRRPSR